MQYSVTRSYGNIEEYLHWSAVRERGRDGQAYSRQPKHLGVWSKLRNNVMT